MLAGVVSQANVQLDLLVLHAVPHSLTLASYQALIPWNYVKLLAPKSPSVEIVG